MNAHSFTVVAPHASSLAHLADLPSQVTVRAWDGSGEFPADRDIEFWAAPFTPVDIGRVLAATPSIRVLQLPTAGADRLPVSLPDDVSVHTARGVHDSAVSEWVLAAVLAANRRLPEFVQAQRDGAPRRLLGQVLDGSRVVLVGHGSVGQSVERRLAGFEVDIVRVARTARDGVLPSSRLVEALTGADVLIVLAPLTAETVGLVGGEHLAALADGALVVNAGRGEVIDQVALAAELRGGRLRAALDVAVPDPLPDGDPLLALPDVLYTPHVAGVTTDTYPRLNAFLRDQVQRYLEGRRLINAWSPRAQL